MYILPLPTESQQSDRIPKTPLVLCPSKLAIFLSMQYMQGSAASDGATGTSSAMRYRLNNIHAIYTVYLRIAEHKNLIKQSRL